MSVRVEIKQLEGRDHYVLPVVLITEGVHAGSQGPVYYPKEVLQRSAIAWNGKPIVVYHPSMITSTGFAGDPAIFNQQKVGVLFNCQFIHDGRTPARLRAEAWIDKERVGLVDRRVLDAINERKMMEVSTGLTFMAGDDLWENTGCWNGEQFNVVARIIQPDHLAILPDQVGACSIADGAGLLRNEEFEAPLQGLLVV